MEALELMDPIFWRGKRVLVTGHTGFKGSWLTLKLAALGADVVGIALPPSGDFDLFRRAGVGRACASHPIDLRDADAVRVIVRATRPEIVFHLAAQPLVRASYRTPVETWSTNVMGTMHLLDALRAIDRLAAVVVVTSDKCYAHGDAHRPFVETDALGGRDPYSASKAATEIAVASFAKSFFDDTTVGIATARAGNVMGGGDGAADRLVPDLVRGALAGRSVGLRYPQAVRPWQHVTDPLHGYLTLAEALADAPQAFAGAWNFGPDASTCGMAVADVAARFVASFGRGSRWHAEADATLHEAASLALDSAKAKERLGWRPQWSIDEAIQLTALAYGVLVDGGDVASEMLRQFGTNGKAAASSTSTSSPTSEQVAA